MEWLRDIHDRDNEPCNHDATWIHSHQYSISGCGILISGRGFIIEVGVVSPFPISLSSAPQNLFFQFIKSLLSYCLCLHHSIHGNLSNYILHTIRHDVITHRHYHGNKLFVTFTVKSSDKKLRHLDKHVPNSFHDNLRDLFQDDTALHLHGNDLSNLFR